MNILMLHPHDIFSPLEPWTIRVVSFAREFTKLGHKVKLIYFPLNFSKSKKIEKEINFEVIPLCRKLGIINFLKNILFVVKISLWADIIHFQKCFYWATLPALIASWINKKPIHYDWDDWETEIFYECKDSSFWRNIVGKFVHFLEDYLPKIVDTISVSSQTLYKLSIKLGKLEDKIFKVPVGVDLEKFNPRLSGELIREKYNLKGEIILYLGQLHSGQYAELFIYAADEILKRHPDSEINFLLVGGGFRLEELKKLTKYLGLDGKVIFTGSVPHEEVPLFIASADICVACFEDNDITRAKSPLKVVEYLACGKAVVASRVGEVTEMVDGAGILTKPGDIFSLAEGIMKLLYNKNLRAELEKKTRQRIEKEYNWPALAQNLLRAYRLALDNRWIRT